MPLVYKCACCGRVVEKPYNAMPYKKGWACNECYVKLVVPAQDRKKELMRRKYANYK